MSEIFREGHKISILFKECDDTMKKEILLFSFCFLLLAGCSNTTIEDSEQREDTQKMQVQTVERSGKTAVLLEDVTLKNCYSALTDENREKVWTSLPEEQPLRKGALLLVLKNEGDTIRVFVPTGDTTEALYGELAAAVVSEKEEDLHQANMANVLDQTAYESINGVPAERLTGYVKILSRDGTWCQVQPFSGGDDRTFWIPRESLSFSIDSIVMDREP